MKKARAPRKVGLILMAGFTLLLWRAEIRPQTTSQTSISGFVREIGTERPVSGVKVSAAPAEGPGVETVSNEAGEFILTGTGPGPQRILTEKSGYAPAKPDGRKLPGNSGIWLTPPADKTLKDVVIHIAAVGGIAGRVLDPLGHPVARVEVYAARFAYDIYGERHLQPASAISSVRNGVTNDAGDFRIAGLEPASYYVVVQPPLSLTPATPNEAFVPTIYYPATTDVSKAEMLDVQPGNNYRLPAIVLTTVQAGTLRIHMMDPDGDTHEASSKFVSLHRQGDEGQPFALGMKPEAYGGVGYVDLGPRAPGRYDMEIGWLAASGLPQLLTRKTIDVGATGAALDLPVVRGPSVTGRALLEQPGGEPLSVGDVQYDLLPKDGGIPVKGTSNSNGSFDSEAVPPGTYNVAWSGLTPDVYVIDLEQSNSVKGSDYIHVGTEDVHLTLHLGRSGGTVDGHVDSNSKIRKAAGATVVLVPDAPFRDNGFLYKTATTDQDGAFRIRSIAPGAYHLFAWTELEGTAYRNAAFMTRYERSGKVVIIKNNDKQSVDVRLADDGKNP